jgi:hypothetical protein
VLVGLVLLANTTGVLDWSVWLTASRYWPVLLIVMGVLVLFGLGVPGVLVLLTLALVPLSLLAPGPVAGWRHHLLLPEAEGPGPSGGGVARFEKEVEPGIESADITLSLHDGDLEVSGGSNGLVEADVEYAGERPSLSYSRSGSTAVVGLGVTGLRRGGSSTRSTVRLNDSLRVSLAVTAGRSRCRLDLSSVALESLDIKMGAGQCAIVFGDRGLRTDVSISAGASDVTLLVPSTVGVRLRVVGLVVDENLAASGLARENGYWVSKDTTTPRSTLDIRVASAVGRVALERR